MTADARGGFIQFQHTAIGGDEDPDDVPSIDVPFRISTGCLVTRFPMEKGHLKDWKPGDKSWRETGVRHLETGEGSGGVPTQM